MCLFRGNVCKSCTTFMQGAFPAAAPWNCWWGSLFSAMFEIRRKNSTLSAPFFMAMLTLGSSPGARMGFRFFVQEVGVMAIPESFQDFPLAPKLKHQCSFVKKSKASGNFHWCKLGFPVQISRSRLTKKISQCNPAELFSLECHGQACSQNLCFCSRRRQKQSCHWSHRGWAQCTRKTRIHAIPAGWQPSAPLPGSGEQLGVGQEPAEPGVLHKGT